MVLDGRQLSDTAGTFRWSNTNPPKFIHQLLSFIRTNAHQFRKLHSFGIHFNHLHWLRDGHLRVKLPEPCINQRNCDSIADKRLTETAELKAWLIHGVMITATIRTNTIAQLTTMGVGTS